MPKRRRTFRPTSLFTRPSGEWRTATLLDHGEPGRARVSRMSPDGWLVEAIIVEQSGRLVIESLHITYPDELELPLGGLTSRMLRDLKPHTNLESLRDVLLKMLGGATLQKKPPELVGFSPAAVKRGSPGRRGHGNAHYADVAAAYDHAVNIVGSKSPVDDLRRDYSLSPVRMADHVRKAREKGFLTPAPPGRAGGQVTEAAAEISDAARQLFESRRRGSAKKPRGARRPKRKGK